MNQGKIIGTSLLAGLLLGGCNITDLDNYTPPESTITGRVLFEGRPIGVRSGGVQLELWQPAYELNTKIPVRVAYDGTFAAAVFDGSYEINLLPGNGPWLNNPTRIPVAVNGQANVDIEVTPYYTIENESITFNPAGGGPHGTVQASFSVRQVNPTQALEYVGLYVGTTVLVDRNTSLSIPNSQRERLRSAILSELNSNSPISISVTLPANIYETQSPVRREHVFVRVGVKTAGVAEMLFSPVYRIAI